MQKKRDLTYNYDEISRVFLIVCVWLVVLKKKKIFLSHELP